ncbi:nitroreductase family protein [Bacillus cytotoxicus]|uniref:nitroreductase family protein n=1 Tax=Bacillus cereus group sp. BfR-BA-01492 TaxID=2920361 RepID=UPI001F57F516|nr:nitroreductase family protein [Bacillus cereus group sp. BfR-BA-01492]EMA6341726.1 nitroreductase family protein [Bacillus cytotoxicus]
MNFEELANARRSAIKFLKDIEIPEEDFKKIFELTKLSPSCYNLQHAHYIVIRNQERKEKLRELAFGQYKVSSASAVVIVCGDKKAYQNVENIYFGMKVLKMIDECEYINTVQKTKDLYEGRGERFMEDEAIRNASLSAMTFMYAAKYYGYDTCPMIGFDEEAMKKELNIPDHLMPMLMITMGKADTSKVRARGYRKPVGEFVTYESF